jgi:hypothetical protein
MERQSLGDFCVYTIVDGKRLDRLAKAGRTEPFSERKPWVTAQRLWLRARSDNQAMVVLLGDAADCSRLLYWGVLTEVHITDDGTGFQVDALRKIPGKHSPQELVLRDSGRTIALNFIKPYAICRTPKFVRLGLSGRGHE